MILKKIALLFLTLIVLQACEKADKADPCPQSDIPEDHRVGYVPISVRYLHEAVALDSFKVWRGDKDITRIKDFESAQFREMQETGYYPLAYDEMKNDFFNKTVDVKFVGYIKDQIVAQKTVQLTANECYVYGNESDLEILVRRLDGGCTDDFRTILVETKDKTGNHIHLTDYKVFDGDKDITVYYAWQIIGFYPIIHDGMIDEFFGKEVDLKFIGYIGNKVVAEKIIRVSGDDCHVFSLTKDLQIIIE